MYMAPQRRQDLNRRVLKWFRRGSAHKKTLQRYEEQCGIFVTRVPENR